MFTVIVELCGPKKNTLLFLSATLFNVMHKQNETQNLVFGNWIEK